MAKPIKHYGKWRIRWTDENGKRQSGIFDDFKTASYELKKRETEVEEIKKGLRAPNPINRTFNELCDYWIEHRASQKRSKKDDESIIKTHLRPFFGKLSLKEISVERADHFRAEKAHLSPKTVSNILTLLITMLNLAADLNWLHRVPNIKKPKINPFADDYSFLRTEEEIQRFLEAAKVEGEIPYLMYATAIYTGMRAGELAALKFSHIRFNGNKSLITVQASFNNPTKSGKVRYVPVLAPIYPLLMEWKQKRNEPDGYVFPNRDGNMQRESGRIYQEVFHRVLERAGFPKIMRNGKEARYIKFHDLRHTLASHWAMQGGDKYKLQTLLGHSDFKMTMRYAHLSPDAFEKEFELLGKCIHEESDNIIPLYSKK